jgi:urease accessory protein
MMAPGSFSRRLAPAGLALVFVAALNSAALAHPGHVGGFTDGLAHPFSGLDHLLAMVAVGLWASQLGRPAFWILPLTFPAVMALGAAVGLSGSALPWVEVALAASVLVLGGVVAFGLKPSLAASLAIIAAFAFVHGYAHGGELPQSASALAYGAGFIVATLALHAIGLALGAAPRAKIMPRVAGAGIAAAGLVLLVLA